MLLVDICYEAIKYFILYKQYYSNKLKISTWKDYSSITYNLSR